MKEVTKTADAGNRFLPPLIRYARATRLAEEKTAEENAHLRRALEVEKRVGHRIAVQARTVALVITAIALVIINPRLEVLYYHAVLALFIALGWLQLRVAKVGQSRAELALIQLDLMLLALVLLVPNPFLVEDWPTAIQFRFEGFTFYFLFLGAATLAYSWRTVVSFGLWTALIWTIGAVLVAWYGHTVPELSTSVAAAVGDRQRLFEIIDPNSVNWEGRLQEIIVFVLVAGVLALKSWRSNQLLLRQAEIATERANLSRYFPPTLVEDLATRNDPLGQVRSQPVAVLFADLVGFTKFAETREPEEIVETLRQVHAMLEQQVFGHGGTLDKYLGDGVMATFGTPTEGEDDAARALAAARAICQASQTWNEERVRSAKPALQLSVGVHYGTVVLGDIGTERRLEFAALGDTVNVASRLEQATRELGVRLVVSDAVISRIDDSDIKQELTAELTPHKGFGLRGRSEALDIWTA